MSRLRKRQIIPEETPIKATLTGPKIVKGNFGRQVELVVMVTEGGDENEYKGVQFKTWFSFGRDDETKEEYVSYGGPLYQLLDMVTEDLDDVLNDEDLSDRDYEKFLKQTVHKLDDLEIVAKVGVKVKKDDEDKPVEKQKRSNYLLPGTFGPELEGIEALDMGESA